MDASVVLHVIRSWMNHMLKFQFLLLKGLVDRRTFASRIICLNFSCVLFIVSLIVLLLCVCFRLVTLFTDELGHISHWRAIMAGSLAGMVATIVTYPTDVIKTRLIVQNRLAPSYEGILHAFYKIYHQEGLRALYRGVSPAILGKTIMGWSHLTACFLLQLFSVFTCSLDFERQQECFLVEDVEICKALQY